MCLYLRSVYVYICVRLSMSMGVAVCVIAETLTPPVFSTDQSVCAYDQSTKGMLIGEGSVMMVIKKKTNVKQGTKVKKETPGQERYECQ